jgi:hypothetical protein
LNAALPFLIYAQVRPFRLAQFIHLTEQVRVIEVQILTLIFKPLYETVEKPPSERLMENVQLQGFRNPEE